MDYLIIAKTAGAPSEDVSEESLQYHAVIKGAKDPTSAIAIFLHAYHTVPNFVEITVQMVAVINARNYESRHEGQWEM